MPCWPPQVAHEPVCVDAVRHVVRRTRRHGQELLSADNGGLFQQYPGRSGHVDDELFVKR